MPISITGTGTITGISAGGLPDLSITTADIADSAITTAKIAAGAVVPADLSQPLTLATSVATTSGTVVDFTGIPTWAKRITVMLSNVSTNGVSLLRMQLGVGGVATTTGYLGSSFASAGAGVANATFSSGVDFADVSADSDRKHGNTVFTSVTGNTWSFTGMIHLSNTARCSYVAGSVPLAGTLNMVRVTTVNGSDTFDSGSINIMYEG